jgi:hypothetical protein
MSIGGVEVRLSRFGRRHEMEVGDHLRGSDAFCGWEGLFGLLRQISQRKR